MPVLHAGGNPDDVTRLYHLYGTVPALNAAGARGLDQDLAERMGVPGLACARFEGDGATA
jgi:hypothetical protein